MGNMLILRDILNGTKSSAYLGNSLGFIYAHISKFGNMLSWDYQIQ